LRTDFDTSFKGDYDIPTNIGAGDFGAGDLGSDIYGDYYDASKLDDLLSDLNIKGDTSITGEDDYVPIWNLHEVGGGSGYGDSTHISLKSILEGQERVLLGQEPMPNGGTDEMFMKNLNRINDIRAERIPSQDPLDIEMINRIRGTNGKPPLELSDMPPLVDRSLKPRGYKIMGPG